MRSKVKVMNERQNITDEELDRFKNFDSLLNKHYRILNEKKPVSWKLIIPAAVLIGLVAVYWWMNKDSGLQTNEIIISDSVSQPESPKDTMKSIPETSESEDKEAGTRKAGHAVPKKTIPDNRPADTPVNDSVVISRDLSLDSPPLVQKDPSPGTVQKTETVYVQAEPVNGYDSLYAYFSNELIYPEAAVKDSIEGVLIVKFLINKAGKAEKIETSGSLGVLFDQEAVRLIENMPPWKPATVNGRPITSKLSIPLTFQLRNKK